ncbi:enoyl-CoA hydratase-related protein, partial [Mycolicibacterium smegmatis]
MNEFIKIVLGSAPEQTGVATLLLSRPPTNALTRQMYREISIAANELAQRADVSSVIVYGGHEIFCAGDDIPELRTLDAEETAAADHALQRCIEAVAAIPKPTVAAVTGYALGSGMNLALAADWR